MIINEGCVYRYRLDGRSSRFTSYSRIFITHITARKVFYKVEYKDSNGRRFYNGYGRYKKDFVESFEIDYVESLKYILTEKGEGDASLRLIK